MMPERQSIRSNSGQERKKFLVFAVGAEAHHAFDAGAVVPTAIEQHHFAGRGKMRHIALEIPTCFFPFGRRAECDDAADSRIQAFSDSLDDAPFSGRIAPFENHDDFQSLVLDPFLQLDQLDLQPGQLFFVVLVFDFVRLGVDIAFAECPRQFGRRHVAGESLVVLVFLVLLVLLLILFVFLFLVLVISSMCSAITSMACVLFGRVE